MYVSLNEITAPAKLDRHIFSPPNTKQWIEWSNTYLNGRNISYEQCDIFLFYSISWTVFVLLVALVLHGFWLVVCARLRSNWYDAVVRESPLHLANKRYFAVRMQHDQHMAADARTRTATFSLKAWTVLCYIMHIWSYENIENWMWLAFLLCCSAVDLTNNVCMRCMPPWCCWFLYHRAACCVLDAESQHEKSRTTKPIT